MLSDPCPRTMRIGSRTIVPCQTLLHHVDHLPADPREELHAPLPDVRLADLQRVG